MKNHAAGYPSKGVARYAPAVHNHYTKTDMEEVAGGIGFYIPLDQIRQCATAKCL